MNNKINTRYLFQLRNMFKKPPKPLGRWGVEKTHESILVGNYYSNIDHCDNCNYDKKHVEHIFKPKKP